MKILLCGEGPHDVGVIEWSIRPDKSGIQEGWLQPLLDKIVDGISEYSVVQLIRLISLPGKSFEKERPKGHGLKAAIAKRRAIAEGCQMVVFMIDADSPDPKVWKAKRDDILSGFEFVPGDMKCIACVPMGTSESWLLASTEGWKRLGLDVSDQLPSHPEAIWGAPGDPTSNHPKQVFKRVCEVAKLDDCRSTRVEIIKNARINEIVDRCPISFAVFVADLAA
jgi:hypothetical protein